MPIEKDRTSEREVLSIKRLGSASEIRIPQVCHALNRTLISAVSYRQHYPMAIDGERAIAKASVTLALVGKGRAIAPLAARCHQSSPR